MRVEAEPQHLDALLKFAARAYRRPLSTPENEDLIAYYHLLRDKSGLTHEEAMRDSLVSILMSPKFCYRIDLMSEAPHHAAALRTASFDLPRSNPFRTMTLASSLSYFLWSSMPDEELLAHAAKGDLQKPKVLSAADVPDAEG